MRNTLTGDSRLRALAGGAAVMVSAAVAQPAHAAQLVDGQVSFATQDQSIWSSGEAFMFNYSDFFGLDVNPAPVTINPGVTSGTGYSVDPYFLFDSDFRAGIEIGASVNGGSVNANVDYNVSLAAPDAITPGQPFSLTGSATKLGSSGFQSSPANAEAYIDGILDVYFGGYARFVTSGVALGSHDYRMGNKGFTDGNTTNTPYRTLANVNLSPEIVGINRNASGQLHVLGANQGGSGSQYSVGATTITAGNWNVAATGGLFGDALLGSDEVTMLTATLDVDQLAAGGSPVFGTGFAHDWGAINIDVGYEIIDVKASLGIGLRQDFAINSDVNVRLNFSEDVSVEGVGVTDTLTAPIDAIPAITLLGDSVTVTPEYLIDASLNNNTALTFTVGMDFVIIEGHIYAAYDAGIFGSGTAANASLGPIYEAHPSYPIGDIDVFNDTFALSGFNVIQGESFVLTAGVQGDLDGDGFVGIADLNVVLGNWNQAVTPGDVPAGDYDGDGFVGITDLNAVLGNWNAGTPPTDGSNVPEPGSVLALGLVGLVMGSKRRT